MNKVLASWIGVGALVVLALFFVFSGDTASSVSQTGSSAGANVTVKDGVQYVSVNVKGGYNPRNSTIQ